MSKKLTTEEFIEKCITIHGNLYDYSMVTYTGGKNKIKIICQIHGIFEQKGNNHINLKQGCPHCKGGVKITREEFITKAKDIHGDKYDYSSLIYNGIHTRADIICPIHGIFTQIPANHINCGNGCPKCANEYTAKKQSLSHKAFIDSARKYHGDKYDYSLVEYKNGRKKVKIVCPIHGIFEQAASSHLMGCGCPHCAHTISKQEVDFGDFIRSIYHHEIITNTRRIIPPYEIDLYIPDKQLAFEYNGTYWHEEGVTKPFGYHQMKIDLCSSKGVKLHHIWEKDWIEDNEFMKECIRRLLK